MGAGRGAQKWCKIHALESPHLRDTAREPGNSYTNSQIKGLLLGPINSLLLLACLMGRVAFYGSGRKNPLGGRGSHRNRDAYSTLGSQQESIGKFKACEWPPIAYITSPGISIIWLAFCHIQVHSAMTSCSSNSIP